jgi:hypothetical protein
MIEDWMGITRQGSTTSDIYISTVSTSPQMNNVKQTCIGERPCICDQCTVAHVTCIVIEHEPVHIGARPYVCDQCVVSCITCDAIEREPIDIGERPHVCDQCQKLFNLILVKCLDTGEIPVDLSVDRDDSNIRAVDLCDANSVQRVWVNDNSNVYGVVADVEVG